MMALMMIPLSKLVNHATQHALLAKDHFWMIVSLAIQPSGLKMEHSLPPVYVMMALMTTLLIFVSPAISLVSPVLALPQPAQHVILQILESYLQHPVFVFLTILTMEMKHVQFVPAAVRTALARLPSVLHVPSIGNLMVQVANV